MNIQTMTTQTEPEAPVPGPEELSPFVREFFLVQTMGFRGMAYRDEHGVWRAAFNQHPLLGEVCVLE